MPFEGPFSVGLVDLTGLSVRPAGDLRAWRTGRCVLCVSRGTRPARNALIAECLCHCLLPDLTRIIAAYDTRPGTPPDGVRSKWWLSALL
jgi:hypothetical protein